jgi:hypothetical protein
MRKKNSEKRADKPDAVSDRRAAQAPYSSEAEDYRGGKIKSPKPESGPANKMRDGESN